MKPSLNLASRTYLNRQLLYASYGITILVLGIALAGVGYYLWECRQQAVGIGRETAQIERQLAAFGGGSQAAATAEDYQDLQDRIAFANSILRKDTFRWTALLDKLETVVPEGVGLRSIQPDYREGSLRIGGLARDLDKLQAFLDNLLTSPDFAKVFLLNQQRLDPKEGLGREALSFTVILKGAF